MNDKEAIDMMQRCAHELRSLRAQRDALAPMAEAYEVIRDIVRMASPRSGGAMSIDLIWTLEKRIQELQPKPAATEETFDES